MKFIEKIIWTIIALSLSGVIALFVNFNFIYHILIPDSCAYDTEHIQTGKLFDLFFEISSNTGFHPEPTRFNVYFTISIGVILGALASYKIVWSTKTKE